MQAHLTEAERFYRVWSALLIDEQDVGYLGITEPMHEENPPLGGVWFMHTVLLPFGDR